MKEFKVGGKFTLEVVEKPNMPQCEGCFFHHGVACDINYILRKCHCSNRSDGKNVIFVKKGK